MSTTSSSASDDTLQWGSTDNPEPRRHRAITWTTNNASQTPVHWRSTDEKVITVSPIDASSATLTVVGPGASLIIASRPGESPICRYAAVGAVFAYDKGNALRMASTETWHVVQKGAEPPAPFPSLSDMNNSNACVAYVPDSGKIVMNLDRIANLVEGAARTTYFKPNYLSNHGERAATSLAEAATSSGEEIQTYAYSPDGTLWYIAGSGEKAWPKKDLNELPPDFPLIENFERVGAALAWAPPADAGFCVTCTVLNQAAFIVGSGEVSYFVLEEVAQTSTS